MRVSLAVVVAAALVAGPTASRAQICLGTAPFSAGPMRIAGAFNVGDQVKAYGAQFAAGAAKGAFGSVAVTRIAYDEASESATDFAISAGYSVDTDSKGKAQFCPVASFTYENPPDFAGVESSAHSFGLGGAFGGIVSSSPNFDFVPFVSGMYTRASASVSFEGLSESLNQNYGVFTLGAGFVVNHTVTIQPAASFPVGLDGAKPSYGISVGFNFGSR